MMSRLPSVDSSHVRLHRGNGLFADIVLKPTAVAPVASARRCVSAVYWQRTRTET